MPIYEYRCESCGELAEALRPMRDADAPLACRGCGRETMRRLHSVFAAGKASAGGGADAPPAGGCGRCGDPFGGCGLG